MKTFEFFLDQKVTTWMRTDFEVKANDLNEAVKIAKQMYDAGDLEQISWEEIMDTQEILNPKDNGGESTAEIYNMNQLGDVLEVFSNKVGQVENI
jgi:D-mannonate dehydratase